MKVCRAVPQDTLAKRSVNVAIVLQRRLGLQYGCDRDMPSSLGIDMFISTDSKYVAKVKICSVWGSVPKLLHQSQNPHLAGDTPVLTFIST